MLRPVLAAAVVVLVAGMPAGYHAVTFPAYRNFRAVDDGRLLRSGQMSLTGFQRVVREYGVKTVVSLRDAADTSASAPDEGEAAWCAANGVRYVKLPPLPWSAPDGSVPAAANVRRFLDLLADPTTGRPVLVHCFAGIHRTGAVCAAYRVEYQGWPMADAVAEMVSIAPANKPFEADMLNYLRGYAPQRGPAAVGVRPGGR